MKNILEPNPMRENGKKPFFKTKFEMYFIIVTLTAIAGWLAMDALTSKSPEEMAVRQSAELAIERENEKYEPNLFGETEIVEWYEHGEKRRGWRTCRTENDFERFEDSCSRTVEYINERYTAIIPTNRDLLNDENLFELMNNQRRMSSTHHERNYVRWYPNVAHIILDFGDGTGYKISRNGLQIRAVAHENDGEYELVEGRRGSLYPISGSRPREIRWSDKDNLS